MSRNETVGVADKPLHTAARASRLGRQALFAAVMGLIATSSVHATVIASANVSSTLNGPCQSVIPSSDNQTNSVTGNSPQAAGARVNGASPGGRCAVLAEASASSAGLKAKVDLVGTSYTGRAGYRATASYFADDFIVTGPSSGTILTTMSFVYDGTAFAYLVPVNGGNLRGNTSALSNARIDVSGVVGGVSPLTASVSAGAFAGGTNPTITDTELGPGSISTAPFTVTVGVPFSVRMTLNAIASAGATRGTTSPFIGLDGGAISDFGSTLWFNPAGPILDLPQGYTLTSLAAGIVDNRIAADLPDGGGGNGDGQVPAVPPLALMLLGGVLLMRRSRHAPHR